jgi:hypothetical protein
MIVEMDDRQTVAWPPLFEELCNEIPSPGILETEVNALGSGRVGKYFADAQPHFFQALLKVGIRLVVTHLGSEQTDRVFLF